LLGRVFNEIRFFISDLVLHLREFVDPEAVFRRLNSIKIAKRE
jgi:hypothetical protein